jgi:hypothetical protein
MGQVFTGPPVMSTFRRSLGATWRRASRRRHVMLIGLSALGIWLSLRTDPDNGWATALGGLAVLQGVWAIAAAHLARKTLADYPEADQRGLFAKALEHPIGAGLALVALAVMFLGACIVFAPRAHAQVPPGFLTYGPVLAEEQRRYWPDHPDPPALAGLVEQESCVSLRSARCWNPAARLKTAREEGAGMGQVTRAWRADGTLRFDSLAEAVARYGADLDGLSWGTVYTRPDLQLRAMVLMARDAARPFRRAPGWLHFGDAGYNGGVTGVQRERRACAVAEDCDPGLWFGHVEHHCLKSRRPLYAGRSACDINREHVRNVFGPRRAGYVGLIG